MLGFHFKRNKSVAGSETELLQEIRRKLDHLQQTMEHDDKQRKASEVHIHIEVLNLDHPVLESLNFKLDQLDIDELSGALNLGNNFGTMPTADGWKKKNPSVRARSEPGKEQFSKTSAGFSYKR